jgi:hypothetical protein
MLVKTAAHLSAKDYAEVGQKAFGKRFGVFLDLVLLLNLFGVMTSLLMLLHDQVQKLLPSQNAASSTEITAIVLLVAVWPLCLLPSLDKLKFSSGLSISAVLCVITVVIRKAVLECTSTTTKSGTITFSSNESLVINAGHNSSSSSCNQGPAWGSDNVTVAGLMKAAPIIIFAFGTNRSLCFLLLCHPNSHLFFFFFFFFSCSCSCSLKFEILGCQFSIVPIFLSVACPSRIGHGQWHSSRERSEEFSKENQNLGEEGQRQPQDTDTDTDNATSATQIDSSNSTATVSAAQVSHFMPIVYTCLALVTVAFSVIGVSGVLAFPG